LNRNAETPKTQLKALDSIQRKYMG